MFLLWKKAGTTTAQRAGDTTSATDNTGPLPVTETSGAGVLAGLGAPADAAAGTDTGTFSLISLFKRLLQKWTAGLALIAGEAHIGQVGFQQIRVAVEITRPSDTNAYAAGDVVSNDTTTTAINAVAGMARVAGGSGYIVGARLVSNLKSITPRLRVNLWNATGGTVAGDNVAADEVYADRAKRLGFFDLPPLTTPADTTNSDLSKTQDLNLRIPYTLVATTLYFTLETLDAFTPASGQKFWLELIAEVN